MSGYCGMVEVKCILPANLKLFCDNTDQIRVFQNILNNMQIN